MTTAIKNHEGFTLIELMIALAVSAFVLAAAYSTYSSHQKVSSVQKQVVDMQQNIRAGMYLMGREIRMAGYDPYKKSGKSSGAGITVTNGNTFSFSFVADTDLYDNNNDGNIDEKGELKTIAYDLYDAYSDGDNDLGRQVGANKNAAAENIEALEFYYTLADGTQSIAPPVAGDVRSVQITMLARAQRSDKKFYNNETYNTPSGGSWGPYNDNYRRRLLTSNIVCRNMGL